MFRPEAWLHKESLPEDCVGPRTHLILTPVAMLLGSSQHYNKYLK